MPQQKPTCVCGKCKLCVQREKNRAWRKVNKEKVKAKNKRWRQTVKGRKFFKKAQEEYRSRNPGKQVIENRIRRQRNPEKYNARVAVNVALKKGVIFKKPCEKCGDKNSQAHHDDYSKPLEVIWLCPIHHTEHEMRGAHLKSTETDYVHN